MPFQQCFQVLVSLRIKPAIDPSLAAVVRSREGGPTRHARSRNHRPALDQHTYNMSLEDRTDPVFIMVHGNS